MATWQPMKRLQGWWRHCETDINKKRTSDSCVPSRCDVTEESVVQTRPSYTERAWTIDWSLFAPIKNSSKVNLPSLFCYNKWWRHDMMTSRHSPYPWQRRFYQLFFGAYFLQREDLLHHPSNSIIKKPFSTKAFIEEIKYLEGRM